MKNMIRYLFVFVSFFCLNPNVQAQDSTKNIDPGKSHFELGLSYLSNSVYQGRQDSLKVPYFTPTFGYYNKSGFYITSSLSYLNSAGVSRIDLFNLDAGYAFTVKKLSADFYAEKDFYNSQSKNVKSETKGSLNGTLSYDFGFIQPLLQGGIEFNNTNDYYGSFGLAHSFFFADDKFEIKPSLMVNASTQNYYSSYYSKRKFATRKKQTGNGTTVNAYLQNASEFKIMDYELTIPVDYSVGKFIFDFTPTMAMPVNPNVVVTTITPPLGMPVTRTKTEQLNNVFFWSLGVTYSF